MYIQKNIVIENFPARGGVRYSKSSNMTMKPRPKLHTMTSNQFGGILIKNKLSSDPSKEHFFRSPILGQSDRAYLYIYNVLYTVKKTKKPQTSSPWQKILPVRSMQDAIYTYCIRTRSKREWKGPRRV